MTPTREAQNMTRTTKVSISIAINRTYSCNGRYGVSYTIFDGLKESNHATLIPSSLGDEEDTTNEDIRRYLESMIFGKAFGLELNRKQELIGVDCITLEQSKGARAWLARITGKSKQYGFEREFINPSNRYLSRNGNGLINFNDLNPGVYEANSTWRSMRSQRVYFVVQIDGSIITINRDRVHSAMKIVSDDLERASLGYDIDLEFTEKMLAESMINDGSVRNAITTVQTIRGMRLRQCSPYTPNVLLDSEEEDIIRMTSEAETMMMLNIREIENAVNNYDEDIRDGYITGIACGLVKAQRTTDFSSVQFQD
jgi:hypothetical protein